MVRKKNKEIDKKKEKDTTPSPSDKKDEPTKKDKQEKNLPPKEDEKKDIKSPLSPHDEINFPNTLHAINDKDDFLFPVKEILVANPALLSQIDAKYGKLVHNKNVAGAVTMDMKENTITPKMVIDLAHKNQPWVLLHELVHLYTAPYLYAGKKLSLDQKVDIEDQSIKDECIKHYTEITDIYNNAKKAGYNPINGESVEDNIAEFCANVTNANSQAQLMKLGLYDRLMGEISRHVKATKTLSIALKTKDGSPITWDNT